jgi:glycosyltransferase involved in cell wall biosynthesis
MLEAMAAGLPVIASDLPAHLDIVQHQKTGWIAATSDDLRQGLDWLDDTTLNLEVGEAARSWIRSSIGTWDDCASRYAIAYQQLLESGK